MIGKYLKSVDSERKDLTADKSELLGMSPNPTKGEKPPTLSINSFGGRNSSGNSHSAMDNGNSEKNTIYKYIHNICETSSTINKSKISFLVSSP